VRSVYFLAFAAICTGCALQPRDQGYARSILDRPLPTGETKVDQECDFLIREIIRQKTMAQALPSNDLLPETALAIQRATQTNIAALELRAKQVPCPPGPDHDDPDRAH
jgi:hypothetical protein